MGSHVTMDVPAFIRVAGNPTKQAGVNSIGMERKAFSKDQIANIKKAYKIFYRDNLRVEDAVERIKAECELDTQINLFLDSIHSSTRGILR